MRSPGVAAVLAILRSSATGGRVSSTSAVDAGNDRCLMPARLCVTSRALIAYERLGAGLHADDRWPVNPELFISYASGDIVRAAALHPHLNAQGFCVWFDAPDARLLVA
jgi:hypothetical protein